MATGNSIGASVSKGKDPLLLGTPIGSSICELSVRSRIAPAVLGLNSVVACDGLASRGENLSSDSSITEFDNEMIDEMLLETEWPGRIVMLEVSLDTNERGLGMNSRVSENPTRLNDLR